MTDTPHRNPEFFERIQKEIDEGAEIPTPGNARARMAIMRGARVRDPLRPW